RRLGDREILCAPAREAAAQREGLREALLRELALRGCRERPGVADHDDRLVLETLEAVAGGENLVRVEMLRPVDVTGGELLGLADVEHEGALVHQADGVLRRDRRLAG